MRLCWLLFRVNVTHTCTSLEIVNASFRAGLCSRTEALEVWVIRRIAEICRVNSSVYAFEDGWSHVFGI